MEICMLSELFYPFVLGGAERRYYEIAKRLAKRHDITVYSLRFHGTQKKEVVDNINIVRVGATHPLDRRSIPHLSTYLPAFFRAFSNYDIIDANYGIASFSGLFKGFSKKPIVATFHDIYWNQWNDYFPFPFSSLGKTMEFAWSKFNYTGIIAVSPNTEKKLRYLGFRPPIDVIPSGIDSKIIESVRAKREKKSAIFVGRLVKYKKVDKLIEAFRTVQDENPDAVLRVVGTGPEEDNLRALSERLGVNAEFHGFVPEEEKIRLIKSSTVLVNPSSVEGLGLVLVESMACGTVVVAKNLDTYFFCNKDNSVLYNKDEEIGGRINGILGNRNSARRISRNGIKTAKKFSWDNTAAAVENLYEKHTKA